MFSAAAQSTSGNVLFLFNSGFPVAENQPIILAPGDVIDTPAKGMTKGFIERLSPYSTGAAEVNFDSLILRSSGATFNTVIMSTQELLAKKGRIFSWQISQLAAGLFSVCGIYNEGVQTTSDPLSFSGSIAVDLVRMQFTDAAAAFHDIVIQPAVGQNVYSFAVQFLDDIGARFNIYYKGDPPYAGWTLLSEDEFDYVPLDDIRLTFNVGRPQYLRVLRTYQTLSTIPPAKLKADPSILDQI